MSRSTNLRASSTTRGRRILLRNALGLGVGRTRQQVRIPSRPASEEAHVAQSKKSAPKRSGNPAKAAAAEKEKQESRSAANRVSRVPVKVKRTGSPNWYAPPW